MNQKVKVLVIVPNRTGVGFFRSIKPHTYIDEFFSNDFEINMIEQFDFTNPNFGKDQDIIHFHTNVGGDYSNWQRKIKELQSYGVKLVMDLDDYWNLPTHFPHYQMYKRDVAEKIKQTIKIVDYVTTTTPLFAKEISKLNKNVIVIPNAVDSRERQFQPIKVKSDRLRVGLILGSSHEKDFEMLRGMVNILKPELDKLQFVLCGFDLRGSMAFIDPKTGEKKTRDIYPHESVWSKYEQILTDNYSIVSEEYKKFLLSYKQIEYPNIENQSYRRCWTKDVSEYATHYNNIDVLLSPLVDCDFNNKKSELKLIEAGFHNKAVIASNTGPYKIGTKSYVEKGGIINTDGNVILVDPNKDAREWAKMVKKLLNDNEMKENLSNNLSTHIKTNYELSVVSKIRSEFYKKIANK